jgi:hypothetical protein
VTAWSGNLAITTPQNRNADSFVTVSKQPSPRPLRLDHRAQVYYIREPSVWVGGLPVPSHSLIDGPTVRARGRPISLLNDAGEPQMDDQLKSRFDQVLQHYADVLRERDDALLREKKAREQFEASFRAAVDNVILPAVAQVKELVRLSHHVFE